jgi:hypothetical protein
MAETFPFGYAIEAARGHTESLVSRRHIRAGLDEAPDPVKVATVGCLVQRPGRNRRHRSRLIVSREDGRFRARDSAANFYADPSEKATPSPP